MMSFNHDDAASAIRVRRAESNAAIAARDVERIVACLLPDITVSVAGGPVLTGRDASRAAFEAEFRDPAFLGYVRDPSEVTVGDSHTIAVERGRWVGRWRRGGKEERKRGLYVAHWRQEEAGWFIYSEVFVSVGL